MVRIKSENFFSSGVYPPSINSCEPKAIELRRQLVSFFVSSCLSLVSENGIESFVKDKGFRFSMAQQSTKKGKKDDLGDPSLPSYPVVNPAQLAREEHTQRKEQT